MKWRRWTWEPERAPVLAAESVPGTAPPLWQDWFPGRENQAELKTAVFFTPSSTSLEDPGHEKRAILNYVVISGKI